MAETKSCAVCCEDFNKSTRKELTCKGCDYSICKSCARTWLTSNSSDPKCMNCNMAWDRNYIVMNLNRSYVDKEYKEHRLKILTDMEMAKMPETIQHAETKKVTKKLQKENIDLNNEIKLYRAKIYEMQNKIARNTYRIAHPNVGDGAFTNERKKFIMPCPEEKCRGFLSTSYKCGICNLYTCPDCLTIIGENKNEEHKCDENNVKSAEMIKKDTRPCPTCGERIFKIEGCDQMFCTAPRKDGSGFCETPFSWKTGKIETGTIHNPHYYALQKQKDNLTRNPGDVLCGGVPDMRILNNILTILFTKGLLNNPYKLNATNQDRLIHHINIATLANIVGIGQFVAEINQYELDRLRREVRDLTDQTNTRVCYLLNEISKEEMGKILIKNDINRQKKVELLNVFEILGVSGIEFLNDLQKSCLHPYGPIMLPETGDQEPLVHVIAVRMQYEIKNMSQDVWLKQIKDVTLIIHEKIVEFKRILNYCNEQFKIIGVNYNTTSYYIPIDQELETTITRDFYRLIKKNWTFKKLKYSIKNIN